MEDGMGRGGDGTEGGGDRPAGGFAVVSASSSAERVTMEAPTRRITISEPMPILGQTNTPRFRNL